VAIAHRVKHGFDLYRQIQRLPSICRFAKFFALCNVNFSIVFYGEVSIGTIPMPISEKGQLLRGARLLARYVFEDEDSWRSMYGPEIKRELGLFMLNARLAGYTGIIDARLDAKVSEALTVPRHRNRRAN